MSALPELLNMHLVADRRQYRLRLLNPPDRLRRAPVVPLGCSNETQYYKTLLAAGRQGHARLHPIGGAWIDNHQQDGSER